MAAERAGKSSKGPSRLVARPDIPENSSEDVIIPGMPPLADGSQGDTTIALAIRTSERLQS
jgi:hypothetical protein